LEVGDPIQIEEECKGWYKGTNLTSKKRGIFPYNYVKVGDSLGALENDSEVILLNLQSVLRNWDTELVSFAVILVFIFYPFRLQNLRNFMPLEERLSS
jgi:hypothetical protein